MIRLDTFEKLLHRLPSLINAASNPSLWALDYLGIDLYDNQIEIVDAVADINQRYVAILEARGAGKCITGDSLIFTENGLVEIEKLNPGAKPEELSPLELLVHSKDGVVKTSHFYNDGIRKTRKIRTEWGYELEGTYNHPIYVIDTDGELKFKKLSELKVGDYVCIQRGQNYWSKKEVDLTGFKYISKGKEGQYIKYPLPSNMNREIGRLFGYLVAEGCLTQPGCTIFSNQDENLLQDYKNLIKKYFHYTVARTHNPCPDLVIESMYIKQFLKFCGLAEVKSKDKEIPWSIFQSSREVVTAYLQAYFEGEGSVTIERHSKYTNGYIELSTASEKMSKQLQVVLSNFGIICIRKKFQSFATNGLRIKRNYYRLIIEGENLEIFSREIGFLSKRKRDLLGLLVGKSRNTNKDIIPFINTRLLELYKKYKSPYLNGRHTQGLSNFSRDAWEYMSSLYSGASKNVTYKKLKHFSQFTELLSKHFFFSPIKTIEEGERQVYDLCVPTLHNFTSSSFISHNTYACSIGLVKLCLDIPGFSIGIFGPRSEQASRIIKELKTNVITPNSRVYQTVDWKLTTNSRLQFKNGSYMYALSGSLTAKQEGWHFHLAVLDEAHQLADVAVNQRIIPMLGSYSISKIVKIGISLYRNNFWKSCAHPSTQYRVIRHDWTQCPILLQQGSVLYNGREYSKYIIDQMPLVLKQKMFPDRPDLHYDGSQTEIDFKTQYAMEWVQDINLELSEEDQQKLIDSTHVILKRGIPELKEQYFFGLDTASGTLLPGKKDLDFTALSIWRKGANNIKEKVACYEWQGGVLGQIEEIEQIIHPEHGIFPCVFGLVDYSNIGINIVEAFKAKGIPIDGIMFNSTESITHKNYKNAMFDQFKFELQAGRVKYPILSQIQEHKLFQKAFNEWLNLERHQKLGINSIIQAPPDLHDDHACADVMCVWAADRNSNFIQNVGVKYNIPNMVWSDSIMSRGIKGPGSDKSPYL